MTQQNGLSRILQLLPLLSSLLLLNGPSVSFVTPATAAAVTTSPPKKSKTRYNTPDRFVSSSPLSTAAVCSDGIALLTVHTAVSHEPLLVPHTNTTNTTTPSSNITTIDTQLPDLPRDHIGPKRIERITSSSHSCTCLMAAGWMTDGVTLARKCRSVAASRVARYGVEEGGSDGGRGLAEGIASWMALCDFSDNVRPLSCVGLLSSCGTSPPNTSQNNLRRLWLIDATGAYRVRAYAVGHGADVVNARLTKIDFSKLSKEEGAQRLLDVVSEGGRVVGGEDAATSGAWSLPPKSMVEVGVIDCVTKKMKRIRQPFLT